MQKKLIPETKMERELRHLREQQDMQECACASAHDMPASLNNLSSDAVAFLNRPSLRELKQKTIEREADEYLERIADFDSRR